MVTIFNEAYIKKLLDDKCITHQELTDAAGINRANFTTRINNPMPISKPYRKKTMAGLKKLHVEFDMTSLFIKKETS